MKYPSVSIIIVNFNGKSLLEESLPSVLNQSYPKNAYEIIVVDNNSQDDTVPFLKKHFPKITLIESEDNLGFTGGNQLGLAQAKGDYIVLLNSDVVVDQNWLSQLVEAAKPTDVGIVSSRLRYFVPFLEVEIASDAYPKSQMNRGIDHSPVGVGIEEVICCSDAFTNMAVYRDGFYEKIGKDPIIRRTNGHGRILLPFDNTKEECLYRITMHGFNTQEIPPLNIKITCGSLVLYSGVVKPCEVNQIGLKLKRSALKPYFTWLVQNAGNIVLRSGYGKDRGNISLRGEDEYIQGYEEESQYFLEPCELLSACGASCLIKRKVIDHVGFLDGHYYMYYEDMELSLRAWRAGWKIVYAPKSVGYHRHRATTGEEETSFFLEHVERNHLAFLISHFPLSTFLSEWVFFLLRLLSCGFWSFAFQFRDLGTAHKYKIRYLGRKAAFNYILHSWPRLLKSRFVLARNWPMDYKKLSARLY